MIEGGYCHIHRNKIFNNYDGIICSTAIPEISYNEIKKNRRHGVILCKKANPQFFKNEIKSNGEVGLFIKDGSSGAGNIVKNKIMLNPINLVIDNASIKTKNVIKDNMVCEDIRSPYTYNCAIM